MQWKNWFSLATQSPDVKAKKNLSSEGGLSKNSPVQINTQKSLTREEKLRVGAKNFSRDFTYAIDKLSRE